MRISSFTVMSLVVAVGCEKPTTTRPAPGLVPVLVAKAEKQSVPVQARTIGTVKAGASVAIRPRVSGQLIEVFFKEGAYVTIGQKLFGIDPRPYQAAVKQAESTLAKSRAVLAGAELDLHRAERVNTGGAGAAIELDLK